MWALDQQHVEALRAAEIDQVKSWLRPGMRVLELGGGNGFQAAIIASWGCQVTSIDVGQPSVGSPVRYPVQEYDGRTIPFPDRSFDAVFSSNVLEHIPHLLSMLAETARVIVPGGIMIHILPSSQWRLWTILSHYTFLSKLLCSLLLSGTPGSRPSGDASTWSGRRGPLALLKRALFSGAHGAYPNALYELYAFSERRWLGVFRERGLEIVHCAGNGLFYTGYAVLPQLPLGVRRQLARVLGSAARIYVMRVSR